MKFRWLAIALLGLFISCSSNNAEEQNLNVSPTAPESTETAEAALIPPESDAYLISETGIGDAQLGMTLGELKSQLGDSMELGEDDIFMVDFNAIPVIKNNEIQYYILHSSFEPLTDSSAIEMLATDNPAYRTEAGVGAKTLIRDAATVYGDATLAYNLENESREYINFANSPADNITFRGNDSTGNFIGIYPEDTSNSYQETTEYQEDAVIRSVMVLQPRLGS